ncbi:MAG: HEAT repeat domain-containing protein [Treponema sp.]|nr:HEAT repeat domain-containing protein [Treponema sp.]
MTDLLNSIMGFDIPVWALIAFFSVLVLLVLFILWFVNTRIFKSRLRRIINAKDEEQTAEAIKKFELCYPGKKLIRYSRRMERYSRQMGPQVVRETGLADMWLHKLTTSSLPRSSDLKRVLLYCPGSFLFKAFLAAGKHPRLQKTFNAWMEGVGEDKVIRLLSETCRGEEFEPSYGRQFLENHGELLRELTGESEWYARYFAYRILTLDSELLTERSMEDGLCDPHPLIRKIITESINFEREKTWAVLWDKLIHDPVYEVREAARKRIGNEFMDVYSPKNNRLNDDETARVLELLDPDCQEDRLFAMVSLESVNKVLRFPAAAFMDKCGLLSSILAKNTLDDPATMDNTVTVLQKALDVNVSAFLNEYSTGDGAPLMIASRLLTDTGGTQENICYLQKKAFAYFSNKKAEPSNSEIYIKTLEAVAKNGNVKSFELLAEELSRRENDQVFMKFLLEKIPEGAHAILTPCLFRFLENTSFPLREELVQVLGAFSADIILPKVFNILNGRRSDFPHVVRISALKILGLLRLPFNLQRILESLPTLKPEEMEVFGRLIANCYPQDIFEEKVKALFATPDARIRASLIAILPVTKNNSFTKEIRASLKDVDPDVRVSAIKALLGFGEIRLLNQETSMLHDPVERVRIATAEVISMHGNAAALEILKTVMSDPNETDVVKISVIAGLGQASSAEGISILVSVLDAQSEFRDYAEKALSSRTSKRDITQLIDIFKDAEPPLREKLIPVFKGMGRKAEPQVIEILKDEVASFKPYLVKILEETGYVDEAKRRLSNRNVETRREAALLLSLMDTLPAFRGLVLAAKDPDQEVRVCVVKALEKLKSGHSREVLDKLKEDPDNRIRKYTHWALERLDSLSME